MFLQYFLTTLQLHSSPGNFAKQLFKCSSLLDCNENNWKVLDFEFFVGDVICGVGFRPFWLRIPGPGHQLLDGIF